MNTPLPVNHTNFDHFLDNAKIHCQKNGARLTRLRQQILKLVWQSNKPIGAYQIMERLEENSDRDHVAPPTVYRSLDFLLEQDLIHRVHSQNAYIARRTAAQNTSDVLLLCKQCGSATEVPSKAIQQSINLSASQHKFTVLDQILEIKGLCQACKLSPRGTSH